eukprot:scpid39688/ scgid28175/ 
MDNPVERRKSMDSAIGSHVEVLKEGTVWIATTSQLHRSKMSERWLTLARESPTLNLSGDVSENCVFLQCCKVSNGVQRKVQEFDLTDFEMVTSAYSSSSGALGPNRSIIYRFSVHCNASGSHDFYTKDEHNMLSWVAALKQALTKPAEDQSADLFAVTFERQGRPNRSAGMTPSVARQASALLCISKETITLLHPLTEEAIEQWTADSLSSLSVNSNAHVLQLHICDSCQPRDGGVYTVTCPSGAQQPASAIISTLTLQSCMRKSEREIMCEFQHTCETKFGSDSRPESRSSGASSWCGSCGNLCETAAPMQMVGQLMKTSARQQLMSIYDQDEKQKVSPTRSFEEKKSTDPDGYMIMKSEEKMDRAGTMPTGGCPSPAEKFRRTKSATFSIHNRLQRTNHQQVSGTRSWNTSQLSRETATKGEPTYVEPAQLLSRHSHLPDSIPPLKPSVERTASEQSSTSTCPSEHYATSFVVSQATSVANPSTTVENSSSGISCHSSSSAASASAATSTADGDMSETDEDGYAFMAFPVPEKRPLQPTLSFKYTNKPLQAVTEAEDANKVAHRTRSSPSMLANSNRWQSRTHPGYKVARRASPSFSELEKRAAAANAKVRQRKDEERGYITPEPVLHPRRHLTSTSSSASLPLPLDYSGKAPEENYMRFSCNGSSGEHAKTSASGSPDSGIGQDSLAMGEQDQCKASKVAVIKKRVRQSNALQKSRYNSGEPTHVLLSQGDQLPPLPPKPADLSPVAKDSTAPELPPDRPSSASPVPPRPPKPSVSPMPSSQGQ